MSQVFNSSNYENEGLIQECEDICNLGAAGISGNTAKLRTFTRRINEAKDRFLQLAFKYDQLWNFDDTKQTDLPVATTSLVSGTKDYLFDDELLQVTQVFAKDSNGTFNELLPQDDRNEPRAYDLQSSTGTPTKYELVGNSIILDPTPNYASSGGLKVTFKRNGVRFATANGAVAIGIPSLFFNYLARHASYPFLVEKSLKHANAVKQLIMEDEVAIAQFISNRAKPKRAGLQVKKESNK